MILGSYNAGIGASLVSADYLGWEIKFAHIPDNTTKNIVQRHFPQVPIYTSSIPNINVEVFSIYTPGPPRHTHGRIPHLDSNYLELALQSIKFASQLSSRWVVIETHPCFLKSNRGKDFAKVLNALGKLGYGFAYRVLDSQFFGIPQARRSLFIVGYFGDWRPPAAVLFDQISSREYFQEDRKKQFIPRLPEELAQEGPFVLPYKVAHQTHIYKLCPRLPYLKERYDEYQHIPFVIVSEDEVRHFSPIEAERLQGFLDNWTKFSDQSETLHYKQRLSIICNSGCVPVYIWLFKRLEQVHGLLI